MELIKADDVLSGDRIIGPCGAPVTVKRIKRTPAGDGTYRLRFDFEGVNYWWPCVSSDYMVERHRYTN